MLGEQMLWNVITQDTLCTIKTHEANVETTGVNLVDVLTITICVIHFLELLEYGHWDKTSGFELIVFGMLHISKPKDIQFKPPPGKPKDVSTGPAPDLAVILRLRSLLQEPYCLSTLESHVFNQAFQLSIVHLKALPLEVVPMLALAADGERCSNQHCGRLSKRIRPRAPSGLLSRAPHQHLQQQPAL